MTLLYQRTIKNIVKTSGIGLHSGKLTHLTLRPLDVNSGIIFRKINNDSEFIDIKASNNNTINSEAYNNVLQSYNTYVLYTITKLKNGSDATNIEQGILFNKMKDDAEQLNSGNLLAVDCDLTQGCKGASVIEGSGLDNNFLKIINGATGKNNTTEVKLDKFVVSEKFNSGFALDLMVKDVSIANSLIKDLTTKNPLSKSVSHYLSKTLEELGGNPDHTEVYKVLLKN